MNNKLFTLIAVSQIVMLSACNNLNAVSDQTKQVQHQQENDETAQQKEAEPAISEKEQNAQKTSEEVPMKMSNLVDTFLTRLHVMPHSLLRHSIFVF